MKKKQAIYEKVVDKYKLWRIQNQILPDKKTRYNQIKKNATKAKIKMQKMIPTVVKHQERKNLVS